MKIKNIKEYVKGLIREEIELFKYQQTKQRDSMLTEDEEKTILKISRNDAVGKIKNSGGKIITVIFIKRSDGTERAMNCKYGVRSSKGGELRYDPEQKGLIPVYDMKIQEFRMINISGIKAMKIQGNYYEID